MPIKKLKPIKTRNKTAKRRWPATPVLPETAQPIHYHYYPQRPRQFNFGKLSFGLFLVVIGVLYLASNLGWLNIDFNFNLWQLWPLLIVFWGLSLLTGKTLASILAGIVLTLTVLAITFILVLGAADYKIDITSSVPVPAAGPSASPSTTPPF